MFPPVEKPGSATRIAARAADITAPSDITHRVASARLLPGERKQIVGGVGNDQCVAAVGGVQNIAQNQEVGGVHLRVRGDLHR
ncbi:MAG: hypothetical protein WDN04_09160 [Rhodospirillales bacterium]